MLAGTVANRKTFIIDPKGNLAHAYDSVGAEHGFSRLFPCVLLPLFRVTHSFSRKSFLRMY
jgi:hypothetical protein